MHDNPNSGSRNVSVVAHGSWFGRGGVEFWGALGQEVAGVSDVVVSATSGRPHVAQRAAAATAVAVAVAVGGAAAVSAAVFWGSDDVQWGFFLLARLEWDCFFLLVTGSCEYQLINRLVSQSLTQSVISQSISHAINQSVNRSVSQSVGQLVRLVSRRTSVRFRFGSPLSSKVVVCRRCHRCDFVPRSK